MGFKKKKNNKLGKLKGKLKINKKKKNKHKN